MKSVRNRFDLEKRKKLKELLSKGYTTTQIAKELNFTHLSVRHEIRKGGTSRDDYNPELAHEITLSNIKKQGVAPIKDSEGFIEEVCNKYISGWSRKKIQEFYGFGTLRAVRIFDKVKQIISLRDDETVDFTHADSLETRVSALEMQMEIIIEQLRGLNERRNTQNNKL